MKRILWLNVALGLLFLAIAVGSAAANTTISSATNDALTLSVNGVSASIVLSAGTYTATTLATELQSKINSHVDILT